MKQTRSKVTMHFDERGAQYIVVAYIVMVSFILCFAYGREYFL